MILLVEDDEILQMMVMKQLKRLGYLASAVSDGKQAVDRVKTDEAVKLILMDVQMPQMNGIQACKAIREFEGTNGRNQVPIIALTANLDSNSCLQAGMNDFLFKPIMLEQLKGILEKWLPANL